MPNALKLGIGLGLFLAGPFLTVAYLLGVGL